MSKKINIKTQSYQKKTGFTSSKLVLELSGTNMNYVIANTLRRVAQDEIPTYAFALVLIEHNTSIFNNDMMRLRLSQLPIFNVDNPIFYLHPKYWKDVNYRDINREKHKDEISIEAIINYYNNTNEVVNVTTDDILYYVNNEETKYETPNPILLIQLRPNETFKCQLIGCLGIGESNNIWAAANNAYYDIIDEHKLLFTIESNNQMTEYEILKKACLIIKLKLDGIEKDIRERLTKREIEETNILFLDINEEDHTMGNLINNKLQDHKDILFSGVYKPDLLVKQIRFKISAIKTVKSPLPALFEVINNLKNDYDDIEKQLK